MMVFLLVDRSESYIGEPLQIQRSLIQDNNNVTVFSIIQQKNEKSAIRVDWRVARTSHLMKVVDVIIEGTSISNTLRSDFRSTIRSQGQSITGLLEVLRKKNSILRRQTSHEHLRQHDIKVL